MSVILRLFLAIALALPLSASAYAQSDGSTSGQKVNRVIKLRSSSTQPENSNQDQADEVDASKTSRKRRSAQTAKLPDPTKMAFDAIGEVAPAAQDPQPSVRVADATPIDTVTSTRFGSQERNSARAIAQTSANSVPQVATQRNWNRERSAPNQRSVYSQPGQPVLAQGQPSNANLPATIHTVAPEVVTRVVAPKFVNVEQTTPIVIQVQNTSQANARHIRLIAHLPSHAKFVSATPQPAEVDGGRYEFAISDLPSKSIKEIQIEVVPTEKRNLEIDAEVLVPARQTMSVSVRQPQLRLHVSGAQTTNTGAIAKQVVTVENVGDGIAHGLEVACHLPQGWELANRQRDLRWEQLAPGQTTQVTFETMAYAAGEHELEFQLVSADGDPRTTKHAMTVYQPQLTVTATGPNMNFVNRDGIYEVQIHNSGQVDVTDVELALAAPAGMTVTTVSQKATLDQRTGILVWNFKQLPAGATQTIHLKALVTAAGKQVCRIAASSKETRAEQIELTTDVRTRADVSINMMNDGKPVAVGGQTRFAVRVHNNGSNTADEVNVLIELPPSLMPVTNENYVISELDNSIRFSSLAIPAGESRELAFEAVGVTTGEHVVRSILTLQGSERRLIAEDSVFVFESDHAKITESLKPEIRR